MKKSTVFSIALAVGFAAVFAACLKDAENVNTPAVIEQSAPVTDEGVSDRGTCSKTVTITGAVGLTLCGNINWYPGSTCSGCQGAGFGAYAIETNNATVTMINSCFSVMNNTNSARTIGFSVSGNVGICPISGGFLIPAHGSGAFCISKSGSCCVVTAVSCE